MTRPLLVALALLAAAPAVAQEGTAAAYCTNLADAADDARYANKLARIEEAEKQVAERIDALEAKRKETEDWLSRREKFMTLAQQNLVTLYSGMAPDAAAAQLVAMDAPTAAALLAKIAPRPAAAIMNEMPADKAAGLATIMAGLSRAAEKKS